MPGEPRLPRRVSMTALIILGVPSALFGLSSLLHPVLPDGVTRFIDPALSLTCHRLPQRLLTMPWGPSGLCSRCTGFWLGLLTCALTLHLSRRAPASLVPAVLLLLPGLVDVVLLMAGLWSGSNLVRSVTGLAGGWGFGMLMWPMAPAVARKRKSQHGGR